MDGMDDIPAGTVPTGYGYDCEDQPAQQPSVWPGRGGLAAAGVPVLGPAYYQNPSAGGAHVALFYRNFQAKGGGSYRHIGLGVNAMHTVKTLRAYRVRCAAHGVWVPADVQQVLTRDPSITHAVVEAPWIPAAGMLDLMRAFPSVEFLVRNHSNIGFLQVDRGGARILRDCLALSETEPNLELSSNSLRWCRYAERVYQGHCLWLPNLYYLERAAASRKPAQAHHHRVLRACSFGSIRIIKNHATAAAAAQEVARLRGCDLEFYVSTNREEHGKGILGALGDMFAGLKWARLVGVPWESWPEFRRTISVMDLAFQVSMSETFNLVTADACAEGVPCVVGEAIEWAPDHWKGNIDDPGELARIGNGLLSDPHAAAAGYAALVAYNRAAALAWLAWLRGDKGSGHPPGF